MTDVDIRELATRFEAVKISMSQDKNGFILKLSCHPNDTPEDLLRDHVGTRYMMVAVRLDEEGKPEPSSEQKEGAHAVKVAGALCSDTRFQQWLCVVQLADSIDEESAVAAVRKYCGINSRKELATNSQAREKFSGLRAEFMEHLRHGV